MGTASILLWVALPYACLTIMVVGLIWRYRTDQYGWTSRSSQFHENAILRAASPLFHFGILFVGAGHVAGLLIPKSVTEAVGVSEHLYHLGATVGGSVAALMTLVGMFGLLYRRFVVGSVRLATTRRDLVAWFFLAVPILLGTYATVRHQLFGGVGYDYRLTISPWLRSLLLLQPEPQLMTQVPVEFQLHIVAAFLLFAVWPFTRLVHVVSAPIMYPTRPYLVYRSRSACTSAQVRRRWGVAGKWPR